MTTHGRWYEEPDSPLGARDLCEAFDPPPPLDPELREAMARRLESRVRRARMRLVVSVSVGCGVAAAAAIALFVSVPSGTRPDTVAQIHETLRPEPDAGAFRSADAIADEPAGTPDIRTLGHRAPVDAAVDRTQDAVDSPDAALAPADEPDWNSQLWQGVRECLRRGDNACVIAALEGRTRTAQELSLLIETYRTMDNRAAAMRHMREFVELFPEDRRVSRYREYISAHEGTADERPRRLRRHQNTRATNALFGSLLGSTPMVDGASVPEVDAGAHPLTSDLLRRAFLSNRSSLQRCYDDRARDEATPPTVRFDIALRISRSGRVTHVDALGTDWKGIAACLNHSMAGWVFPASDHGGETVIPIVFSGS